MSSTASDTAGFDRLTKAIHAQTEKLTGSVATLGDQIHREHDLEKKVDHLQTEMNEVRLSIKDVQIASNEKYTTLEVQMSNMAGEVKATKQTSETNKKILISLFCTVFALGLGGLWAIASGG